MKLPIDTSAIAFLCALAPEPVIDFETKRRTPKLSAAFYRETIARNAVA